MKVEITAKATKNLANEIVLFHEWITISSANPLIQFSEGEEYKIIIKKLTKAGKNSRRDVIE